METFRFIWLQACLHSVYLVLADGELGGPPHPLSGFTAVNTLWNEWNVLFLSCLSLPV